MIRKISLALLVSLACGPGFNIRSARAAEIKDATACAAGTWQKAGQAVIFRNDMYGTLKSYLTRARATLTLNTRSLDGFAVLADSEAVKIPGTLKSQGLAFDGSSIVFSWRYGLQRTDNDYRPLITRALAIPPDIQAEHYDSGKKSGFSHIGDIDIAGGKLYAPIEDEDNHMKPFIAIFDPKTLLYTGEKHELPVRYFPHGVPWVAIDESRGVFYAMDWNSQDLQVFDLKTYGFVKSVRIKNMDHPERQLTRIQGGKVRNGLLYISSDSNDDVIGLRGGKLKRKYLYEINPVSGLAKEIVHLDEPERTEMEGLAFSQDGTLHVLMLEPYFYNDRFPPNFEINGDDWSPSTTIVSFKQSLCR